MKLLAFSFLLIAGLGFIAGCGGTSTPVTPVTSEAVHRANSSCPCIYVANEHAANGYGSILVFRAGAAGDAAPIQNIRGSKTGLNEPWGVAVDASGNIYVASTGGGPSGNGAVLIFAAGSKGNVAPIATISGSNTGLDYPDGIALDPVNGEIYVANVRCPTTSCAGPTITIYAPGSNGNVTPLGTIQGSNTQLYSPGGLALDASGNIYVPNVLGGDTNEHEGVLTIYPAGSTGNVAPSQAIDGLTRVGEPFQIALDSSADMYVANAGDPYLDYGFVEVFTPDQYGIYSPSQQIFGKRTELSVPAGIALDSSNNIYVANSYTNTLTVYASNANGDAKPIRKIKGKKTKLDHPEGIAIR